MTLLAELSVAESILLFVGSTTPILLAIILAIRRFVMLEDRVKDIEKRLSEGDSDELDTRGN